ncbi:type II toxin-antitoxin system PemK/MazF family toxin [Methylocapsa aurea]|uniref:type II toxin-antitoxin system PemK/MazF family toxin n=1 Tax=Methylocapsa aurea TaxID=663610 RepID=UPI00055D87C6|nr:type II toxin-antitoxin system PemK/MazF family toxin [Methylocapsa aurea]
MRRGDLIVVAAPGDYGKPRPAVIIQSDALDETGSLLVCLLTTTQRPAPFYRLALAPTPENGLRDPSDVMVDKIFALPRGKCGEPIGRLTRAQIRALNYALSLVVGLADPGMVD